MRKIVFSNAKGGVGKTTTAVSVAHGLALKGKKVLLVDLDTQGQCAVSLGVSPALGLADLVDGAKLQECLLEAREGLCLLRGGLDLAAVTRSISRRDFKSEAVLSDALKEVPVLGFDFVLIDTAPSFGPLNVNAFFFASEIVVPASLEGLTLHGLKDFLASVATIQEHRPELQVSHVVPTRYDQRLKASGEVLGQLRAAFGDKVASPIRTSSRLLEAAPLGKTIFEYAPASPGAQDYETLVDLVLAQ